jgi:imidazole glycerol phosphate synthase glutamine amidotransferase subunit|tara:strand:+ start:41413 stop:42033 length:621 start_codon:yes stop_codon:yes gene_type:complete
MINILNFGYGNAASIANTLESMEYPFKLVSHPKELVPGVLIVPGVGSIGVFSENLRRNQWKTHIQKYAKEGNNIIGICLGLHAFTSFSEESGGMRCMALLGKNIKTTVLNKDSEKSNTGWLPFSITKEFLDNNSWVPFYGRSRKQSLKGRVFYNHIYGANIKAKNSLQIQGYENFSSIVVKKNIMGIQFHPEKSQALGKLILEFIL